MKRKLKSLILITVLVLVVAAIMPQSASAATISYGSRDTNMWMQYYSGGWHNLETPEHFVKGSSPEQVAYCLQHKKTSPSSSGTSYWDTDILDRYSTITKTGLLSLLENGYPFSTGGLGADEARYATANAIRFWLSEREYYEGGDNFYNFTDLHQYNNDQLRAMAASGTIGSNVRTRPGYNNGVLQFAIELLIKARNQEEVRHSINFSSSSLNLSTNGSYFVGSTTVSLENCKRYDINYSLPAGSQITGYTGNHGDVLTFRIPISAANAGVSYGISATGYDERTRSNIYANAPISSDPQILGTVGREIYGEAAYSKLTVKTPATPDLTITSIWPSDTAESSSIPTINYRTHVDTIGWQDWVSDGEVSGTSGQALRLEAIYINIAGISNAIEYRTHVESIGWQDWVNEGGMAGTTGQALKLEAIQIRMKGTMANQYDVYYRAHVESIGWQGWVKNGALAGTSGQSLQMEAIQIKLVPKGAAAPGPISVYSGDSVTVTVAVTNSGNRAVSSAVVQLAPNGLSAQTKTIGSLGAGQSTNVTYTFTAPNVNSSTRLPIVATVDSNNKITESNESNNTASTSVTVWPRPDLVVSSLKTNKTVYNPGDTVTVTATVKNQGYATAAATILKLAPSGLSAQTKSIGSLGAGKSTTATFTFTAPTYTSNKNMSIVATADSTDAVTELSETNNQRSTSVTIQTLPDLIVSSLKTNKTVYNPGDTVTVTATVKNQGYATAATSTLKLAPNGLSAQTKSIGSLGAGKSTTATFTFTAPTYTSNKNMSIVATADSANKITELSETNNQRSTSVTIQALPDLIVSSLKTNKTVYNPGDTVTVTATIKNQGYTTAATSTLKLAPSGLSAQTKSIGSLGAGKSTTATFTFTAPTYTSNKNMSIVATADSANKITELSETNNQRSTSVTIQALPDLVVSTLTTNKATYDAGETVTVTVRVKNQGYSTAATSTLKITANGYPSMTATIPALSKGGTSTAQTFTFTAASNLTATSVNIVATADSTNAVKELSETNNTKSTTIVVNALMPDLTFGDDSTLISSYYTGKDIVIAAQVRNLTAQGVPSVDVKLQLGNATRTENICVPGNGTNVVVFRIKAPSTTGTFPVLMTIDPDNRIAERPPDGENNNRSNEDGTIKYDGSSGSVKTTTVTLVHNDMPDPADARLEADHDARSKAIPSLPTLAKSASHTWTEYRYQSGSYVRKSYWAKLTTTFAISPDPRVAIKDYPDMMESGFGVYVKATTVVSTNYDHPEKLVGPQMYWVYYPETGYWSDTSWYRYNDALETLDSSAGQLNMRWQYAVSPYSVTESRLHYTPVWFPDGMYQAVGQSFYGWTPAGQMYEQVSDTVEIEGSMYDRFPVLNW